MRVQVPADYFVLGWQWALQQPDWNVWLLQAFCSFQGNGELAGMRGVLER